MTANGTVPCFKPVAGRSILTLWFSPRSRDEPIPCSDSFPDWIHSNAERPRLPQASSLPESAPADRPASRSTIVRPANGWRNFRFSKHVYRRRDGGRGRCHRGWTAGCDCRRQCGRRAASPRLQWGDTSHELQPGRKSARRLLRLRIEPAGRCDSRRRAIRGSFQRRSCRRGGSRRRPAGSSPGWHRHHATGPFIHE